MSTEFRSELTNELLCVTFFGGNERGRCLEVGSFSNFFELLDRVRSGEVVSGLGSGGQLTEERLMTFLETERCTFGEFPVTVEVGSGEMFRFTSEV